MQKFINLGGMFKVLALKAKQSTGSLRLLHWQWMPWPLALHNQMSFGHDTILIEVEGRGGSAEKGLLLARCFC